MKRQRGRSRNSGGGSGGKPQHNTNRAFDSNGPEGVKVRGAAQHVYEKYQQLARDAHTAGDRVLAENHLQHAEHYFRVMRVMQPQRPLTEIIGRDQFVSGYDMDFEDEGGAGEAGESEAETSESGEASGERQDRIDGRRDERPREDYRQGDGRSRDDRGRNGSSRGERWSGERPQGERYQGDRSGPAGRDDRALQARDERPRFESRDQPRRDPLTVVEPQGTPLTARPAAQSAPAPEPGHVLRADDGEVNHAPAFLQVRPAEPRTAEPKDETGEARRPRRRRPPTSFEGAGASSEET